MPEARFFFPGTFPGMNEIVAAAKGCRGTGRLYSMMKNNQTNTIALMAKSQYKGKPFDCYSLRFIWFLRDKRRDPDNIIAAKKFILDGLVTAGIFAGDTQKHFVAIDGETWIVHAARPGVEVVVSSAP